MKTKKLILIIAVFLLVIQISLVDSHYFSNRDYLVNVTFNITTDIADPGLKKIGTIAVGKINFTDALVDLGKGTERLKNVSINITEWVDGTEMPVNYTWSASSLANDSNDDYNNLTNALIDVKIVVNGSRSFGERINYSIYFATDGSSNNFVLNPELSNQDHFVWKNTTHAFTRSGSWTATGSGGNTCYRGYTNSATAGGIVDIAFPVSGSYKLWVARYSTPDAGTHIFKFDGTQIYSAGWSGSETACVWTELATINVTDTANHTIEYDFGSGWGYYPVTYLLTTNLSFVPTIAKSHPPTRANMPVVSTYGDENTVLNTLTITGYGIAFVADIIPPHITAYSDQGASCSSWNTDPSTACTTSDTTPSIYFNTSDPAYCAIGVNDENYTTMGSSRNCTSGEGTEEHACTLILQDELVYGDSTVYISCKDTSDNENTTSTSGPLSLTITGLETGGETAIGVGVQNALLSGYTNYTEQQIYARKLDGTQDVGVFDWVAKKGSKVWAFNFITKGEEHVGMFNLTPVLYILEMSNITNSTITTTVETMINATK